VSFNPAVAQTDGVCVVIEGFYQMADGERRVMLLIKLIGKPVDVNSLQKVM
jgi:hypothetical protein